MEGKNSLDILCSVENGMLKIILNRPKHKNAITTSMYKQLVQILHESIQDSTIYIVILTGTGNFFSSGNDFSTLLTNENKDISVNYVDFAINTFKEFIDMLITYPKLLVAIVNGPAIGIAATMLPLFDMVYASDMAYFQTPFTKLGLVAEGCSTYTFPKTFGKSKGGDMLYLGYKMYALEAKQYGLVSEVYKHECPDKVWTYLKKISMLSSGSILAIKRLVKKWNEDTLLNVNAEESTELIKCMQSSDSLERLTSLFLYKSKI